MLGASTLELMNAAQPSPVAGWTEEQWKAQAGRFGYQVFPSDVELITRDEADRLVQEAEARASAAARDGEAAGNGNVAEGDERTLMMPIPSGMTLKEAAEGLLVLGLLTDRKDFEDFLRAARPYSGDIQPGIAIFKGKPTHEELIAELVREKR
jgi:hypothetical protein